MRRPGAAGSGDEAEPTQAKQQGRTIKGAKGKGKGKGFEPGFYGWHGEPKGGWDKGHGY